MKLRIEYESGRRTRAPRDVLASALKLLAAAIAVVAAYLHIS